MLFALHPEMNIGKLTRLEKLDDDTRSAYRKEVLFQNSHQQSKYYCHQLCTVK